MINVYEVAEDRIEQRVSGSMKKSTDIRNGQIAACRASTCTPSGEWIIWEDCAKLDYTDKDSGLRGYIEDICRYYIGLGLEDSAVM